MPCIKSLIMSKPVKHEIGVGPSKLAKGLQSVQYISVWGDLQYY